MKHTLVFHLLEVSKKLQKVLGLKSQHLALSTSQARAILVISSKAQTSQQDIAHKLQLEPASIVTLIDELEKLKLAKRSVAINNRRKYELVLTEKGKTYAQIIKKHTNDIDKLIHSVIGDKESVKFFQTIEKLNKVLNNWHENQNINNRKEVNK